MKLSKEKLISGALAGVVGTLAFGGFFLAIGNRGVIEGAIPALYGLEPSLAVGAAIHLVHGAILGVLYTVIVSAVGYGDHLNSLGKSAVWGVGYGVLTTLLPTLLMPVWLSAVGFPNAPEVPNFNVMGLVGHVIYGVVLAASYTLIRELME